MMDQSSLESFLTNLYSFLLSTLEILSEKYDTCLLAPNRDDGDRSISSATTNHWECDVIVKAKKYPIQLQRMRGGQ